MKQIIQNFGIVITMLSLSFSLSAYDFEVDGLRYSIISSSNLTCKIVQNSDINYSGDFIIPSTVKFKGKELTVTCIGYSAFERCSGLTSVTIPNTITTIEGYAFAYLFDQLRELIIPTSVTTIGSGFLSCTYLDEVRIPNSVNQLGECPFDYGKIKSIIFEDGDKPLVFGKGGVDHGEGIIGYLAECSCENVHLGRIFSYESNSRCFPCLNASTIKTISFGPSITNIPYRAFRGCSSIQSITIPGSINTIEDGAFDGCLALNYVTFEDAENQIEIGQYTTNSGKGDGSVFYNFYCNAGNNDGIHTLYLGRNFSCEFKLLNEYSHLRNLTLGKYVTDATGIFYVWVDGSSRQKHISDGSLCYIKSDAYIPPVLDELSEGRYATITPIIPIDTRTSYKNTTSWSRFWQFEESGVENVIIDNNEESPVEIYNLWGINIGTSIENLTHGIYLKRQGNKNEKILVK